MSGIKVQNIGTQYTSTTSIHAPKILGMVVGVTHYVSEVYIFVNYTYRMIIMLIASY